jgi:hypothetical protein
MFSKLFFKNKKKPNPWGKKFPILKKLVVYQKREKVENL